jgi:GT2 family glycosyltransferase
VIVFIDADCVPQADWLTQMTKPILADGEAMVAGAINASGYLTLPSARGAAYVDKWGNGNLAFTRRVLADVGGYDEDMSVAEDYDFCLRAREAGYRIRFVPEASVLHPHEPLASSLRKSFRYGKGAVKLYCRHPRWARRVTDQHVLYTACYALYLLGLPLTVLVPWYPLSILAPMLLKPKRNPLKELINLAHGAGVLAGLLPLLVTCLGRGHFAVGAPQRSTGAAPLGAPPTQGR